MLFIVFVMYQTYYPEPEVVSIFQNSPPFSLPPFQCPGHSLSHGKLSPVTQLVVRVCFFLLSLPTKHDCCDVTMHAVMIWGLERGRERVSE